MMLDVGPFTRGLEVGDEMLLYWLNVPSITVLLMAHKILEIAAAV